ncbi:hypothetical protein, partial [Williamsia sp.]|uniref:hypothetical protein n=1 Tax=Williamsia sp. TaxID=1872085 RepID=UPI002F938B05
TSELNASVTLQPSGNTSELASALRLTVRESAVCDGSGVVPAGWPSDGVLSSAGGATPITLEGDSTPREFCFYVELPTNTPPLTTDATGPVLWEFQATSVAP